MQWPTQHLGLHLLLQVDEEDGVVRPILVGGVGDYRVTLHLIQDDPNAEPDWDGWTVATCAPDMVMSPLSLSPICIWPLLNGVASGHTSLGQHAKPPLGWRKRKDTGW